MGRLVEDIEKDIAEVSQASVALASNGGGKPSGQAPATEQKTSTERKKWDLKASEEKRKEGQQ